MASLVKRRRKKGVAWLVEFYLFKKRKSFFLPTCYNERDAQTITAITSRLCDAIESGGVIDAKDAAWLSNAPRELVERFERAGLLETSSRLTLRELFDKYERAEEHKQTEATQRLIFYARRVFSALVDESQEVETFDKLAAREFDARLAKSEYADATRAQILSKIKRVFNWGVDVELIERNPFDGVRLPSYKNKRREFFVDRESYEKLLDAAPSLEWRALIALWRIGGLRRAEAFLVTWRDVDWVEGRLLVHSPKTARQGKAERVVPLFPELREELTRLWESLPVGSPGRVVSSLTYNDVRNKFKRIIFRAGLPVWERPVQNLRSSRAIEVYREFGAVAESEWIGHGVETAKKHYLHLLDDDYRRAAFPTDFKEVVKTVEKRAEIDAK